MFPFASRFFGLKVVGPAFMHECDFCGKEVPLVLCTAFAWFTFFFVPIIPYKRVYPLICPVCSHGFVLSKEKFEEVKRVTKCNLALLKGEISEAAHKKEIDLLLGQFESKIRREMEEEEPYVI